MSQGTSQWQFWIDRGGTFTDLIGRDPDGRVHSTKLLSENPQAYPDAAVEGMRRLMGLDPVDAFPSADVALIRMGTTVATNALLERKGEPTLLLTTEGLADILVIGQQHRPRLFDLNIRKTTALYMRVTEARERLAADGSVVTPLDEDHCRTVLEEAKAAGIESVAIVFMHAWVNPDHERRAGDIARDIGFKQVSLSHQTSPLIKIVGRGDTAVADAYLSPVLHRYVAQVADRVGAVDLAFMQSSGGVTAADQFHGRDAILSGPAGGVVGAAKVAQAAGFGQMVGFDMGGTSTDVSHFHGQFARTHDTVIDGVRLKVPMLEVHTVAAGGGSICSFDGLRLRVGPESAGAMPGPAAYRRGGPLTVTDCNVLLGKVRPEHFPHIFGPEGDQPLDTAAVSDGFRAMAEEIKAAGGDSLSPEAVAEGCLTVAVEHMARAIKKITVERGQEIADAVLVAFGGAGAQHACLVADALEMETILVHPFSGILSALGIGLADISEVRDRALERPFNTNGLEQACEEVHGLQTQVGHLLKRQSPQPPHFDNKIFLRVSGSDTALPIDLSVGSSTLQDLQQAFDKAHKARFGFVDQEKSLVIQSVQVTGAIAGQTALQQVPETADEPLDQTGQIYCEGQWRTARIINRVTLRGEAEVIGPAIITDPLTTVTVEPGWRARIGEDGSILLTRAQPRDRTGGDTSVDPIRLEVFNNLFMSVAEQMGAVLELTAHSVNMKERLDFSCAVFDRNGGLVANAPHMPVHLGSMGTSVRSVIDAARKSGQGLQRGDHWMVNDPYAGGTHLPDVTVVAPVFLEAEDEPAFFVAARGHHADIGGLTPGSMPPNSRTIDDEGVRIEPTLIVRDDRLLETSIRELLASARYPARLPDQTIADLKAQIAANERGIAEVARLIGQFTAPVVLSYMNHVQTNAEEAVRRVLAKLPAGDCCYAMDNGAQIRVRLKVDQKARTAIVDFTGTSDQTDDNFNAPLAVTRAAVLYVLRCLVGDDIPLNEGCLKPVDIIVPEGCLLNPNPPAATVAGNVETSQAVTNALFLAAGAVAASQGTMNNLTFGTNRYQYYETIAGGAGAGDGFDGASAVQTHMTNSRLTDPEVLEKRYPVRLRRFGVRRGSGGDGRWRGGDGIIREIEALEPMDVSILSLCRAIAPPGLNGGGNAALGRTTVVRHDGNVEILGYAQSTTLNTADRIVVETPGGGGYGTPTQQED